jgi:CO/xanthine dehydrogenase FAD-binding subunit
MYELDVHSPLTLDEALQLKNKHGENLKILAGGTDILVHIRNDIEALGERPSLLNLSKIEGLDFVKDTMDYVEIGPLVTHSELIQSQLIRRYIPALGKAAGFIGSPQIRNQGTLGGNIVNASPAADSLPILYARDAEIEVSTIDGRTLIPIGEFIKGPGLVDLDPRGIVTKIVVPKLTGYIGDYVSLRQRKATAINVVSLGAEALVTEDFVIEDIRIALGAVSPTVVRAERTERLLQGRVLTSGLIEEAVELISRECVPIDDIRSNKSYRSQMTGVLLEKYLQNIVSSTNPNLSYPKILSFNER